MPLNARSRRRLMIVGGVVVMIGAGLGGAYVLAERAQDRKARAALERGLAAFEQQDYEMSLDGVGRFLQRFGDESTSELLYKYAISRLHTEVPNGRHVIEAVNLLQRIADRDITHVAARTDLMDVRLTLGQNLAILTRAVEVYKAEHGGAPPSSALQLIQYTDEDGKTSASFGAPYLFGPYLRKMPRLSMGTNKGESDIVSGGNPGDAGGAGWWIDGTTGDVRANAPDSDLTADGEKLNEVVASKFLKR